MEMPRFFMTSLLFFLVHVSSPAFDRAPTEVGEPHSRLTITVSMERPSTHYFHVQLRVEEPGSNTIDVKMPVWTPGYYRIMDYERNVLNFRAEDDAGRSVVWEKTTRNSWRLWTGKAT